jgi:cobalt/nickel transport system permease protein
MAHSEIYTQIDHYAYTNKLTKISPISKIFFALSTLVICVSSASLIVPIMVFVVNAILLIGSAKIKADFFLHLLFYPTIFVGLSCIFIALFFGFGASFAEFNLPWFTWTIYKNGIAISVTTFFRVVGSLSCLFFLVLTTPITDLCIILRQARIPKVVVELSLLIYRYIFVFLEVAVKMNTAQKLRLGHSNWLKSIRSTALLGGNLFIRTLEQGERTFIAMNARGYDGNFRVLEELPKPKITALFVVLLFDLLLVVTMLLTMNIGVV